VFGSVRPPLGSGEQVAEDPSGARIPGGGADAPPAPGLAKETYGPTSRTGADAPSAASVFGSVRAPLGSTGGAAVGAAGASVFGSVRPVFGSLNPPLGSAGGAGEARSTEVVSMGSGARSAFGFGSVRPPLGGGRWGAKIGRGRASRKGARGAREGTVGQRGRTCVRVWVGPRATGQLGRDWAARVGRARVGGGLWLWVSASATWGWQRWGCPGRSSIIADVIACVRGGVHLGASSDLNIRLRQRST